jgi:hypothetical protein
MSPLRITLLVVKITAALSGLASGFLLFYSLTIVSSPFRPIVQNGAHLCFDGKLLAAGYGGPLVLTSEPCPGWEQAKPVALVSTEHPKYVPWGLRLLALSFLLQLVDICVSYGTHAEQAPDHKR